jgi:hypothetical protein
MYVRTILLLVVFVLAPCISHAQSLIGDWYVIQVPEVTLPHTNRFILSVTKDSVGIRATLDSLGLVQNERSSRGIPFFRWKIVKTVTSRNGDTITIIAKDAKGRHQGMRFSQPGSDEYVLAMSKEAQNLTTALEHEYNDFWIVITERKYQALQALKDPASITTEDLVSILKRIRSDLTNMKATLNFKKDLNASMGLSLILPLNRMILSELEMLGYNPSKWSRSATDILALHMEDTRVAHLMEELRQITRGL